MKICHVNLASGFSGGERQTLTLIKQQLKMGYELNVVANPKSEFTDEVRNLNCKLFLAQHFLLGHTKLASQGCLSIHVHEGRAVYWALIQHLLTQCPYLITRRIDNPLKNKFFLNMAYRRAKIIVGLSSAITSEIHRIHPDVKIQKIPDSPVTYPVNKTKAYEIRKQFQGKFIVIQAAKFLAHKGFDVSVTCAKKLERSHPEIQFCLLGDGPEFEKIQKQSQTLKNLVLMGMQTNMGDWFEAADLLIHPSYSEGLGSVILEASKAGLPVIGTRAGGIPDIIQEGKNGLLVKSGDALALALAIVSIAGNKSFTEDFNLDRKEILKKFEISETSKQYQRLYFE